MFKKICLFLFMFSILITSGHACESFSLDEIIGDYRKTFPAPPLKGLYDKETAFNGTTFLLGFLGIKEKDEITLSLHTIDTQHNFDSLQNTMMFHHYYQMQSVDFISKTERDQKIGHLYRILVHALNDYNPIVGYLYGSAFKSAYLFDLQTQKGKVLSRGVDLQERLEYEAYRYIQESLKSIGITFHFVVIPDVFHTYALSLSCEDEKIGPETPEIEQYGHAISMIAKETNVCVMSLSDLKDIYGISFDMFIKTNQQSVLQGAHTLNPKEVQGLKGFFEKEYEYEKGTKKEKGARALERAKRYIALKKFVKQYEDRFILNTFLSFFGSNVALVPFSIHVEDYMQNCAKLPIRPLSKFKGGCNPQHQLPLLQRTSSGSYQFYSIRNDIMKKFIQQRILMRIIEIDGYKTYFYEGDKNFEIF